MDTKRQFALGIFFLAALSILAGYTLFLTDFTLLGDVVKETVYFPAAHGLREGDPVMVSGLRIGRVKSLDFEVDAPPERRIQALLTLNEPVELMESARVTIRESTLLGGRQVDIYPGEYGGRPLARNPDGSIYGSVEQNPIEALGSFSDLLTENREAIRNTLENLDAITLAAREGRGPLGRLLNDEAMGGDLASSIANVREFTDHVNQGQGLLGRLIHDEELVASVKGAVESVDTILKDLRAGSGVAGRLLYDDELAQEVAKAVESFSNVGQRIDRGEGVAGKLLGDEALGDKVESMIDDFKSASADLQFVAAQVREGEGSLGRLLMDRELYDEALTSVRLITRTLEDYRESAPISTFTSALFRGF